ncbi:MAG: NPCBM/NEW2 domain-containing protein [Phycisphaerae bacterium]
MRGAAAWIIAGWVGAAMAQGRMEVEAADAGGRADSSAGPVGAWPAPVPVRLKPAGRDDLLIMTLGKIQTPLAEGVYDPVADRVTRRDGSTIESYYRRELGVRYFTPLDKSVFPTPPAGWCSWYYYYQEITPEEVLLNAGWMARHLASHGARYVQIDDGWQGVGRGLGENRDWSTIDARFRGLGMAGLAAEIRKFGLEAGIWIAPHGQSNAEFVAARRDAFLWKPDGTSASDTWEGRFLVDPSAPRAAGYLAELFRELHGWGYTYFKIDGQPIVLDEFASKREFFRGTRPPPPDEGAPPDAAPAASDEVADAQRDYRGTLRSIRDAIGQRSYLLGCWGIPLAGVGIMNGSRTAGDIVPGFDGFLVAFDAVQNFNYLHNVAWYCDPDVVMVRPPLSDGAARAWATIQGLTGQALLTSDRLPDLPASRVALLKAIYPPVDIRPLDLHAPEPARKSTWILKVAQELPSGARREYDVVGLFNLDREHTKTIHLPWVRLGRDGPVLHHVFDYWSGVYLGCWEQGLFVEVPPGDVRVLTIMPAEARPQLLSTSRHITQGWIDVLDVVSDEVDGTPRLRGRSRLIAHEPYVLTFALPRAAPTWTLRDARARGLSGGDVRVECRAHQGAATVALRSAGSQEVEWELRFAPATPYVYPVQPPAGLAVQPSGLFDAEARWSSEYHSSAAHRVEIDGAPAGVSFHRRAVLRELAPGQRVMVGVRSVWYDGSVSEKVIEREFVVAPPASVHLSEIEPEVVRQGWGSLKRDRSVDGNPLTVAGETAARGLGTHADATIAYRIRGAFERFETRVGIDDEILADAKPEVLFEVHGDGRKLWESGPMRRGETAKPATVDVRGVELLELRVLCGEDGIDHDHADWLDVRLIAPPPATTTGPTTTATTGPTATTAPTAPFAPGTSTPPTTPRE